jgi:hypothetical protein
MPRTRRPPVSIALLALAAALGLAAPAAATVRVAASDSRGVTLEVTVGAWTLSRPAADGRVRIVGVPGSHEMAVPGRAMLPAWAATLALPPGARPTARVLASSGEQSRGDTRLIIAGQPVLRGDAGDRLGPQPGMDAVPAIADGPWPDASIDMGEAFAFRGRRLVALEIRPFRYDETTSRVWSPLALTVRVDFNLPGGAAALPAGTGAPDRNVDPALRTSVLNWDQASGWRIAPPRLADAKSRFGTRPAGAAAALAFEESEPEVRVRLDETALYRLPFDDLAARGFPALVPVAEVSVHRHEYLEGATPPYGTFELPCEIQDANGNGTFDSGDAVWLWSRNWAERTGASTIRRYWGDGEVVFVTRRAGGGLRVPHRAGWNGVAGLTPPASYPFTQHHERDAAPIMPFVVSPADSNVGIWHWTEASSYYNRPDTIRVAAHGLDDTRDATFTGRWMGRRSNFHILWAAIRNGAGTVTQLVDSTTAAWFGKFPISRTVTIPGTALTDGNNNFLRQWGKQLFADPHPVTNGAVDAGLDWFDLTYWRRYRALQDYLRFNSSDATGDVQLSVSGFLSDSIRVYDVTDPGQPVRVVLDPAHVIAGPTDVRFEIQDVVAGPRREYVAAAIQDPPDPAFGPRTPPASAYGAVTRRNLHSAVTGDYLLVVPETFAAAVTPLADLRRSQGLTVLEAPLESVCDEFGDGRRSPAAIQRFARYAYQQWDSRFLMLVGDGSLDPNRVRTFSGRDWIPVIPSIGPVSTTEGYEIVPSDNRYAFISGNEDPLFTADTNRVVPEMMVGRLTVNSAAEASTVIGKIVNYENVQPTDLWRRKVLLMTDDAFSGETTFGGGGTPTGYCHRDYEEFFIGINDTMEGFVSSDSGLAGLDVEQFNLRSYLPNESWVIDPVLRDTCRVSRDDTRATCHAGVTPTLIGKLSAGALMWNYQGHGNEHLMTHEDLYINSGTGLGDDSNRLGNVGKPFFFTAFSCHVNMFARPDQQLNSAVGPSIGEDLLALPDGRGSIASWASVCYEVVPRNTVNHVNIELIRSLFVNPPRDEALGADDRGSRVVLGEAILSTLFRYLGVARSFASERGLAITYTLLGDPATRMSIGRPLSRVLANGTPVTSGQPIRLHTPGDTVRIEADVASMVRLDSLALYENTGGGDVPVAGVTVTPAFPDTAAATSLHGGRRFKLVHTARPAPRTTEYAVVARDRNGLVQRTDLVLRLEGSLRVSGAPIADDDEVAPNADLSLLLLSPAPIPDPRNQIALTVNGATQEFTATQAPGDASFREWILSWPHADYPIDQYTVGAAVVGGGGVTHRFRVTAASSRLALRDLFPFPNPFDNGGTRFSFVLLGGEPADVKLHVYSQSGRSIYRKTFVGLVPGYHQLAWDGHDAEGDELANGVYFYRLSATTPSGGATQQLGRLVKLRKPRRVEEPVIP